MTSKQSALLPKRSRSLRMLHLVSECQRKHYKREYRRLVRRSAKAAIVEALKLEQR